MVRFMAMGVFAWKAFTFSKEHNETMTFCFLLLALLFQPFVKISIGRILWNIIDIVVSVYLIVNYIKEMNSKGSK